MSKIMNHCPVCGPECSDNAPRIKDGSRANRQAVKAHRKAVARSIKRSEDRDWQRDALSEMVCLEM